MDLSSFFFVATAAITPHLVVLISEIYLRFLKMGSYLCCCLRRRPKDNLNHVSIVVLGELAQSPRMLNHARAALKSSSHIAVDLIGIASKGIE